MSSIPSKGRFGSYSVNSSFDNLARENTFTKDLRIINAQNIPVRTYTPNVKVIIGVLVTVTVVAVVGAVITVGVVLAGKTEHGKDGTTTPGMNPTTSSVTLRTSSTTAKVNGSDGTTTPGMNPTTSSITLRTSSTTAKVNRSDGTRTPGMNPTTSSVTLRTTSTTVKLNKSDESTSSGTEQTIILVTSTTLSTSTTANISGVWSEWGSWTTCAVTCGEGIQTRYRTCVKNNMNEIDCSLGYVEQQTCFTVDCPEYGKWTTWLSWNGCTVSCGGGNQSRTRICQKNTTLEIDCVGLNTQFQSCNSYNCPDCTRICNVGTLSADCIRCQCSVIITGRVLNSGSSPIEGVKISLSSAPYVTLDVTDSLGAFSINSTCTGEELLLTRAYYRDTFTVASSTGMTITMANIVLPYITRNPTSKYRLFGENATFCCEAYGEPAIKNYEWFKDGVLLDSALYPNGTHLQITNLAFNSSGAYMCRANSDAGAIKSAHATLYVRNTSDEFCADAYQQKWQSLPDDCVQPDSTAQYEVGTCIAKSCRLNNSSSSQSCGENGISCCGVSKFDIVTVKCNGYQLSIIVVKGCSCKACGIKQVTLSGVAKNVQSGLPLRYGQILLNGVYAKRTNGLGQFSVSLADDVRQATFTAKDDIYKQFLDSTEIINIPEDLSGTYHITIKMLNKNSPIELSSSVENTIYCGTSMNDSTSAVASVVIPPDSFYYPNGTKYNGTVKASLTFFDPSNKDSLQSAPGIFEFVDEEGNAQLLETLGVFNLLIQDQSGLGITVAGGADIFLNSELSSSEPSLSDNLKLWGLSLSSGRWELLESNEEARKRKRREIDINYKKVKRQTGFWRAHVGFSHYYFNLDQFSYYEICFFKVSVFRNSYFIQGNEILGIFLKFDVPIFTSKQFAIYQKGSLTSYGQECFQSRCGYDGFIEVTYTDPTTAKEMAFIPADPVVHGYHGIDNQSSAYINYRVSNDGRALRANFFSSDIGPFYKNLTVCVKSGFNNNHFRFFKETPDPDVYTFLRKFDQNLIGNNLSAIAQAIHAARKVWFPETAPSTYGACTIKIKINYQGQLAYNITVRVISYAGTNLDIVDQIYGIRERMIGSDGSVCIEYKCSGNLDQIIGPQEADKTKIKVIPMVKPPISCNVTTDNLRDEYKLLSSDQTGNSVFESYVPDYYDSNDGLFNAPTDSGNIQGKLDDIVSKAYQKCDNSNFFAVIFSCV